MKPSAETASRNRRSNWDAVSQSAPRGKAHPTPSSNSGTQFPDGGHLGKRIPLWSLIPGRSFPKRTQRESASRFEAQKWDALSARSLNGKARPTLRPDSGTPVSQTGSTGKCVPLWSRIPGRGFRSEPKGKLCPILSANSGMQFPLQAKGPGSQWSRGQKRSVCG